MVVDWVQDLQDGLPSYEDVHYVEEDDDTGFLQTDGHAVGHKYVPQKFAAFCVDFGVVPRVLVELGVNRDMDVDVMSLMELTDNEEELLDELHLPDVVRRNLREMLRTLQRHDNEDQGPEFRWSTAEWVASWDQACDDVARVIQCLRRRLGAETPVEYWPIVRTPRAAAQRVRSLQWARQWTPVIMQILETLVDCHMVQRVDAVPVQPRPRATPASRSRSRDSEGVGEDSSGTSGRPRRVSRAGRRVGTADTGRDRGAPPPLRANANVDVPGSGLATMDGPVPDSVGASEVASSSSSPGASTAQMEGPQGGSATSASLSPVVPVDEAPRVPADVDDDGNSLVQRLQPGEARELQRLGVRRDTITALGLFLGELASICDGTHPGSDVLPEDVQWALRVVERALFLFAGTKDFIASILAARLRRGREGCIFFQMAMDVGVLSRWPMPSWLALHAPIWMISRTCLQMRG